MKQMQTLTVNGVTYGVYDPTAARTDDTVLGEAPWSAKKIVDTLCPGFTETGALVTCAPVEGYPLEVTAEGTVTRCGKNLLDMSARQVKLVSVPTVAGSKVYWGVELALAPGTYTLHAEQLATPAQAQYVYGILASAAGEFIKTVHTVRGGAPEVKTFTAEGACVLYVYAGAWADPQSAGVTKSMAMETFGHYALQLELGDTATACAPYAGETFAPGEAVPALAGVNTLWAESGSVTVTGRAYPWGGGADGI